jgi:peptide subunit release factor 1 (eRF1)
VKPLAELFDSYGGYGVALIDKQGARLFNFHLGEILEQEGFVGDGVRRMKRGGGSQSPGRRSGATGITQHVDEVTDRNMRSAAEVASKFFQENNIRRIVIGGTEDNVAMFRNHLPKTWQSLIVGVVALSKTASYTDVLEKAVQIGQQNEERRHDRIVDAMKTAAAKGRGGVRGLDDTLQMVHEGRVQVLILQEGFRKPGFQCVDCGDVITTQVESCKFCGGSFAKIHDAVEMAVRRVLKEGGEIEVLHDHSELKKLGDIGALLRY